MNKFDTIRLSALACLMIVGAWAPTPGAFSAPQQSCPASITDDQDLCARPLTGCICVTNGSGTATSLLDCEGCLFSFSGSTDCTYSINPPTSTPFACNTQTLCGGSATCGGPCPCNGGGYRPILFSCGSCT